MTGKGLGAHICVAVAMICGIFSAARAQTPPTKPPAEAFAVLPAEPPRISPDGKRFALIRGINGRPAIAVYKVDAPQEPPHIVTSDWIISALRWAKNDVLITYNRTNERRGLFDTLRSLGDVAALTLDNGPMIHLTALARIDDLDLDSRDTIFASYGGKLFRVNVRARGYSEVELRPAPRPGDGIAWLMDGHGNVAGRVDATRDDNNGVPIMHATVKVAERDTWRSLGNYDTPFGRNEDMPALSEDGQAFVGLYPDNSDTISVARFNFSGPAARLFQDPHYDVGGTLRDDWTGRVVGFYVDEDTPAYHYFEPKREALQKGLEQAFPGLSVHAVSIDLAGDRAIVEISGPKTPASYYLYDRVSHHASAVAASYPDLPETAMGEVKPYGYAASDGLHIPAYLTLPPGKSPHNLPLVVVPHGGPDARDDMTFDFIRQFLANRGYAVLQPQFRGSRGFGRAFTQAGFGQWGLKVQSDISDGVKKTIADGIADPGRICIFGASYGGYAALAGATLTPELYACVASLAGPSNLQKLLDYSHDKFGSTAENYWMARIGKDSAQRDAVSPALHADRVTAPVLLLHSELDATVPIEQSEIMEKALRKAGKKVEFVRMPGDDHYMSLEQTRLRVLQEVEKFLAANIGT
jgi:dipeptidyl aminopeptidase/acylaminoacyl peptidase